MRHLLFFLFLLLFGVAASSQQRPDFTRGGSTQQFSTPQGDTTAKKPLAFAYYLIHQVDQDLSDLDSSLHSLSKPEVYYKQKFAGGNLGSENSAYYSPNYALQNVPGLQTGQFIHDINLLNEVKDRVVEVNRSYWKVNYAKGYSISNSNLQADFYRQFNRKILLNFSYRDISDDGEFGLQPNEVGLIDVKLAQESDKGIRRSFVTYHKTFVEETQSRGIVNGVAESATVRNELLQVTAGNLIYFTDSLITEKTPRLQSLVSLSNRKFSFRDDNIQDSELTFYQINTLDDTIQYTSDLQKFSFENEYQFWTGEFHWRTSADLSFSSFQQQSYGPSFRELLLGVSGSKSIGNRGWHLNTSLNYGLLDISGDLSVVAGVRNNSPLGNHGSLSASYRRLNPLLLHRSAMVNAETQWSNHFSSSSILHIDADYFVQKIKAGIRGGLYLISDHIVLNAVANPIQLKNQVRVAEISIDKDLPIGPFNTKHSLMYQYISEPLIQRPELQYRGNVSIDFYLLKRKLASALGVDVYFVPSFQTPAYSPVFGDFYYSDTRVSSGNILLVNPYISFKLDRFLAFFKVVNATSRLTSQPLSWVRDHSIYDYRISFGIRWTLLD